MPRLPRLPSMTARVTGAFPTLYCGKSSTSSDSHKETEFGWSRHLDDDVGEAAAGCFLPAHANGRESRASLPANACSRPTPDAKPGAIQSTAFKVQRSSVRPSRPAGHRPLWSFDGLVNFLGANDWFLSYRSQFHITIITFSVR